MAQKIDTLIIVDDMLTGYDGHPYEYDKSVAAIFSERGIKVAIYGNKNLLPTIQDELKAKPWFLFNSTASVRKIPVLGAIIYRYTFNRAYQRQLEALIAAADREHRHYCLFVTNTYWYTILPVARAFKNITKPVAFLYRTSIYDTSRVPKITKSLILPLINRAVNIIKGNKNVHHFTDSEVIAREWEARFNHPMHVLPIPHLNVPEVTQEPEYKSKIRLYLPGGMRLEKGAELLAEAMQLLCQENPAVAEKILLITQFNSKDELLQQCKEKLAALPLENLFLDNLSTEAYYNEIANADIILIPYQVSEGYRARTSGVLAEAIAAGKPVITTAGTWMADQVAKYDAGLVMEENAASFVKNLTAMIGNYDQYKNQVQQASEKWMRFHSKAHFYKVFTEGIGE